MGRPDGKKLKNIGVEYTVAAHIMAKRSDSMNMTTLYIPIDPMRRYLNQKRKEGKRYGHLSIVIAAIVRTIAHYPALNRFVVNKRIYARNEVAIGMVVLKGGRIDEIGTTDKMKFELDSTIMDVDNVINAYVEKNRSAEDVNGTDKIANTLTSVPGLLRVGVNLMKFLDNHNLMPKAIINASPFHCTMMLTNLASIRTNHIYHHAYDFGTCSLTLAMGNLEDRVVVKNGEITAERCMPLGLVMDERICSGAYFAMAFREFQKYMENPALLELPAENIKTE
jgi:hypothetical protein